MKSLVNFVYKSASSAKYPGHDELAGVLHTKYFTSKYISHPNPCPAIYFLLPSSTDTGHSALTLPPNSWLMMRSNSTHDGRSQQR